MFGHWRGRSLRGGPWWGGWSSMGNAKEMRHWCMPQQNVIESYQLPMGFGRVGPQGSLADGEEVELTLSLLFNRFLCKALNSLVVLLLNGNSLGGPSGFCLPNGYRTTVLSFLDRMGTDGLCFLDRLHSLRIILMEGHAKL